MKKPVQKLGKLTLLFLSVFLIAAACSKDDTPETKTPTPPADTPDGVIQDSIPDSTHTLSVDPNKITQSLKFRNGKVIEGELTSSKSGKRPEVDFKISVDTIYWVEGVINRIKIRKPDAPIILVGSFLAQVEGSDSYIEAEFEQEQENDTIVFLNFDFDATEWDPPFSFNITFVPSDDATTGDLDRIRVPVVIELPSEKDNRGCGLPDGSEWEWNATYMNGDFHTGPGDIAETEGGVTGCCDGQNNSFYGGGCDPNGPYSVSLNYDSSLVVYYDFFLVYRSSSRIIGALKHYANNLDIANTDFCAQSVAYQNSELSNGFEADVNLNNCTFTLENMIGQSEEVNGLSFPKPIYMGSGSNVEYKILSKHAIKETRFNPEDPNNPTPALERYYIRTGFDGDQSPGWFD